VNKLAMVAATAACTWVGIGIHVCLGAVRWDEFLIVGQILEPVDLASLVVEEYFNRVERLGKAVPGVTLRINTGVVLKVIPALTAGKTV
jgi:hypothetical protein